MHSCFIGFIARYPIAARNWNIARIILFVFFSSIELVLPDSKLYFHLSCFYWLEKFLDSKSVDITKVIEG